MLFALWEGMLAWHVERAFRARPDGTIGFYGFGSSAPGYLVSDAAQSERARAVMRGYVRSYLRLAILWCLACLVIGALWNLSLRIPALHDEVVGASPVLGLILMVGNLAVVPAIVLPWHSRIRGLGKEWSTLPPMFTQWKWARCAARRQSRSALTFGAAAGVVIAAASLVLLLRLPDIGRVGTIVLAGIVSAGLCLYVWSRLVIATMRVASDTPRRSRR